MGDHPTERIQLDSLDERGQIQQPRLIDNLFALQPTKKHKSVTHDFSS